MATTRRSQEIAVEEDDVRREAERKAQAAREERQARDDADRLTEHLPRQGEPPRPPMTPAEAAGFGNEKTVKMLLPVPCTLTLPGYHLVQFPAGIVEVPESLADHRYLLAHGASRVK